MTAIDITSVFPKSQVLTPDDGKAYEDSTRRWAQNAEKKAKYVVLPESAEDVSKAIKFATANNLEIAIKGGGHSASGASSTNDLVIDLGRISSVTVNVEKQEAVVGGGALWSAVDEETAKYGLATVGGTVNHTGVGGLTVGGGYGWLTGRHGLTIDILKQVEVVTATGEILICNESENPDLFWGIRGGGSNFGPVTYFTYKVFPQRSTIWSGMLVFPPAKLEELFKTASAWRETASGDESGLLIMACPPPAFKPCMILAPFYNGSAEDGKKKFQPFYDIGPIADMTKEMPYPMVNTLLNFGVTPGARRIQTSTAITVLDPARLRHVFEEYVKLTIEVPEAIRSAVTTELHSNKKILSVPSSNTAFANRGDWFNILFNVRWEDPKLDEQMRAWGKSQIEYIRTEERKHEHVDLEGVHAYSNYGTGDERVRDVFGENYDRLAELKARYDPKNVFHKWFAITPKA